MAASSHAYNHLIYSRPINCVCRCVMIKFRYRWLSSHRTSQLLNGNGSSTRDSNRDGVDRRRNGERATGAGGGY